MTPLLPETPHATYAAYLKAAGSKLPATAPEAALKEVERSGLRRRDSAESEADRERLWFQVHSVRGNDLDATLTNEPYAVSTLRKDERGTHPVSMMSDWAILNPMGHFTPDTLHLLHRRLVPGP